MTMHAARLLGNRVASSELMRIGDWDVLVSERYDRASVNGQWRRLHQEDLCQALSVPPSKKYQRLDGGPGIADIAGLVRSLPLTADRRSTGTAFYRALVFNVIAGCTDAHAKNYSLMLEQRSRAAVEQVHGKSALAVADELLRGMRALPLAAT